MASSVSLYVRRMTRAVSHTCQTPDMTVMQCLFIMNLSVSWKAVSEWTAYIQQPCAAQKPYGSVQHLIEDALDNKLARPFVQQLLDVRCSDASCKKWVHLQQSWGTKDRSNHWSGPFHCCLSTLYTAYRKEVLRHRVRPQAPKVLMHLTKEQHKALQGLFIFDARKEEVSIIAHKRLQLPRSLLAAPRVFILCIDNFSKHKYSRNRGTGQVH